MRKLIGNAVIICILVIYSLLFDKVTAKYNLSTTDYRFYSITGGILLILFLLGLFFLYLRFRNKK